MKKEIIIFVINIKFKLIEYIINFKIYNQQFSFNQKNIKNYIKKIFKLEKLNFVVYNKIYSINYIK